MNSPTLARALTAKFVDSVTGLAIQFVSVDIDSGAVSRRSTALGNIVMQNLTEGAHSMVASIPGYVSQTIPFNVVSGATTKLTVQLVKS
ncbi:MAG TPA: hypothetical protein VE978_24430 [Chitinophagales bacterium]|nr:hypothetical protein [Chitinophagales bacterium]